jgi:hypothetical protein
MKKQRGIYQAITTTFIQETATRGRRIKAESVSGIKIIRPYPDGETHEAHAKIANELIDQLGWRQDREDWFQGATKDGYVFVNVVLEKE